MRSSIPGRESWTLPLAPEIYPRVAGVLLGLLFLTSPLKAELVVFTHGGFMEVESYRVEGDRIHLALRGGGDLEMSIYQIESILTEETPADPEPPQIGFNFRFAESQDVPQTPYGELIYDAARRHKLNPRLIAAVVRAESGFDPQAVSPKGARGLMQLMPANAKYYGLEGEDVFDPEKNIDAGTRYLEYLTRRFEGELSLVLAAYNAGYGMVQKYGGIPPFRETHEYIRRVYAELGLLAGEASEPAAGER